MNGSQGPGPWSVVIFADDLTGAADTAVQFAGYGIPLDIVMHPAPIPALPANLASGPHQSGGGLAIDLDSRALLPQEAYARVQERIRQLLPAMPALLYKKVDSGLRGNLGAELLAVMHLWPERLVVLAPAFPQMGRTTVDGVQCVDGRPVTLHEVGQDMITPVETAHIPTLLRRQLAREFAGDGNTAIGTLPLARVAEGAPAVVDALVAAYRRGERLVVADAQRAQDLLALARGLIASGLPFVAAGSGGFARAFPPALGWASLENDQDLTGADDRPPRSLRVRVRERGQGQRLLVVSLSMKAVAADQLDALQRASNRFRRVDIAPASLAMVSWSLSPASEASQEERRVAAEVLNHLRDDCDVILTVAADAAPVESEQLNAAFSRIVHSVMIDGAAGHGSRGGYGGATPRGLIGAVVAVGGQTAAALCAGVGCTSLRVSGEEMAPGTPLCVMVDGAWPGLPIVLKSGSFGDASTLVRVVGDVDEQE